MTSSNFATSVTVRAIGASTPRIEGQPTHTPVRLTRPVVGLMPTTLFQVAGLRVEAANSWPIAIIPKFAARPAAEPPEDPPTVRERSYGLRVSPKSDPYVSPPAHSPRVVLARMMA